MLRIVAFLVQDLIEMCPVSAFWNQMQKVKVDSVLVYRKLLSARVLIELELSMLSEVDLITENSMRVQLGSVIG